MSVEQDRQNVLTYVRARIEHDVARERENRLRDVMQDAARGCRASVPGVYVFPELNNIAVVIAPNVSYPELVEVVSQ